MSDKRFKIGILGYAKKNVNDYIFEIDKDMKKRLLSKDEEITKLKQQILRLEEESNITNEQKMAISRAMINAEENALTIVKNAEKEAEKILAEAEKNAQSKACEIETKSREEIKNLTMEMLQKRKKIEDEVSTLKMEMKKMYERELKRIMKLRAELKSNRSSSSILDDTENDDFATKETNNHTPDEAYCIPETLSAEEMERLLN